VKYSSKSIVIIGKGVWSNKISQVLFDQDNTLNIEIHSARSFLLRNIQEISQIASGQFLWITTTPELQIEIIKRMESLDFRAILEKPVATKTIKIGEVLDLILNLKADTYLSQPWRYSKVWENTRSAIRNLPTPLKIKVTRGGPVTRDYIDPIEDWVYHDLGLVSELISDYKDHLDIKILSTNTKNLKVNLKVPYKFDIELHIGHFSEKIALWEINDTHVFNFSSQIADGDNPIFTMYLNYKNRTGKNDFSEQLWLVKRVLELLD
jgi:hypothetical protein